MTVANPINYSRTQGFDISVEQEIARIDPAVLWLTVPPVRKGMKPRAAWFGRAAELCKLAEWRVQCGEHLVVCSVGTTVQ